MKCRIRVLLLTGLFFTLGIGCTGPIEVDNNHENGNGNGQEQVNGTCTTSASCDDGDACTADACDDGDCANTPIPDCTSLSTPGGFVTYTFNDAVYRIEAVPGTTPENISAALDALAPGAGDNALNISPDGDWLVLNSERFDEECDGYACLTVVPFDLSGAEVVRAGGEVVHVDAPGADPFSAIASGGNLIVYPGPIGPNSADLFAVSRTGAGWSDPVLLTGDSPYEFNTQPAISADGSRVVFDCGNGEYAAPPAAICEVGTDGQGFRVVRTTEGRPEWDVEGCSLHHPDYEPNGSIVAEPGCEVWRIDGGDPQLVTNEFANDNSPCVLPDGRIASLWLDRPGGPGAHEIKIMSPDGSDWFVLVEDIDVLDIGIGCGGGVRK